MSTGMSIPLDSDGFMRRECPNCQEQFKWHPSEEGGSVRRVDQYHCPLCGQAAGLDSWWTQEQIEYAKVAVMPEAMRQVHDALGAVVRSSKSVKVKVSNDLDEMPIPKPLREPNDMVILEPPCHDSEPVKVPDAAEPPFYCLICGSPFA